MRAVTVVHENSAVADVLSTAAFILPQERMLALLASKGADAVWVASDGKLRATGGYFAISKMGAARKQ